MSNTQTTQYEKHHSFSQFYTTRGIGAVKHQMERAIRLLSENGQTESDLSIRTILEKVLDSLTGKITDSKFHITPFIADEMATLDDLQLSYYLYHRYRYDVHPQDHVLDAGRYRCSGD